MKNKIYIFAVFLVLAMSASAVWADGATLTVSLSQDSPQSVVLNENSQNAEMGRFTLSAQGGDVYISGLRLTTDAPQGLSNFGGIILYDKDNNIVATYPNQSSNPDIMQFSPITIGGGSSKTYLLRATPSSTGAGNVRVGIGEVFYATLEKPSTAGIPALSNTITMPRPSPSITPTPSVSPTISPSASPSPSATPGVTARAYDQYSINDGDLIRAKGNSAVWVVKKSGNKIFKRWLISYKVLSAYPHLLKQQVKLLDESVVGSIPSSYLVRPENSPKVYEIWDIVEGKSAVRRWIPTAEEFTKLGFDFQAVFTINTPEFNLYTESNQLTSPK